MRQWTKPDKEFLLAKNWENSVAQYLWKQIKQLQNLSSYSFLVRALCPNKGLGQESEAPDLPISLCSHVRQA